MSGGVLDGPIKPRVSAHPASLEPEVLLEGCTLGRGRSSGPGGQHRNKVQTLVVLRHDATGIEAQAGERRSGMENHRVAVRRLRLALATEHRTGVPMGEARTQLWLDRTKGTRLSIATKHVDFAAMLAEAIDVVHACGLDHKTAALRLCVSPTQLVRLIKEHPAALARLNKERAGMGMHPLR